MISRLFWFALTVATATPAAAQSPAPERPASAPLCKQAGSTALYVPIEDGKTAEISTSLAAAQSFAFVVPTNPSTGYGWSVAKPPDGSIGSLAGAWIIGAQNPVPGAPTQQIWVFRSLAAGSTAFSIVYSRPWEHGVAPARTVNFKVAVTPPDPSCP